MNNAGDCSFRFRQGWDSDKCPCIFNEYGEYRGNKS